MEMMTLIPKNKTEFLAMTPDDRAYETYREAAEARIQAKRNGGSLLLNRVLLIAGFAATMFCISRCNKQQSAELPPVYKTTMPNAEDVRPADKSIYRIT